MADDIITEVEEWRVIDGWEAYEVSSIGRVRRGVDSKPAIHGHSNFKAGRLKKFVTSSDGYYRVGLLKDGLLRLRPVANLVAHAFIGPKPPGKTVNHINGIKTDNRVANLEYATVLEQAAHARRLGLYDNRGERHSMVKLTEAKVREIRALIAEGIPKLTIARRYGVRDGTIHFIAKRQTWKHIP
jgi:hypothetical protein